MLSTTAQYGLRAMVQLARLAPGTALPGRELAQRAKVPANYLSKVLLELKKAGLVDTARGAGGGYALSRPAESIHLMDIVEILGPMSARPQCLLDFTRDCSDDDPCSAHEKWRSVRSAYVQFLESTALAEIATPATQAE